MFNNGRNGMCIEKNCEMHSTVCKTHANANRNRHHILKRCIEWANDIRPRTSGQSTGSISFLMTVDEEAESDSEKVLDEMNSVRKEIHIKTNMDVMDFFSYMNTKEQTTLVVVEDRRNTEAQFDLAYADVDGEEILTAFDSCSNTTLIHKELVNEDKVKVLKLKKEAV